MTTKLKSATNNVGHPQMMFLLASIAVAGLLAAACSTTDTTATPTADEPNPQSATAEVAAAAELVEPVATAQPVPPTFDVDPGGSPWDLVGIGDSFIGWSTVAEQYAELLGEDLGIEIRVAKIVNPTSNRLEYLRTHDAARHLLTEAEIVVVQPQPGPPSLAAWGPYFAGECGGADNQECFRTALADFDLYIGELFDEVIAITSDDTVIMAPLVGAWGVAAFNPGIEEDDPEAYRILVDHVINLQQLAAAAAADRGIATVDVTRAFHGPDYYQPAAEAYLLPDRTHPSDEGSRVVAELLHGLTSTTP
jgi:hypothetical protein